LSPVTGPARHFVAEPFASQVFSLIAHSRIVYQIEHSAPPLPLPGEHG